MTGTSSRCLVTMVQNLEEDADSVLRYMAFNGLVPNANKTAFLVLNGKSVDAGLSVEIGGVKVPREGSACLLGIKFQDNLQWKCQIFVWQRRLDIGFEQPTLHYPPVAVIEK